MRLNREVSTWSSRDVLPVLGPRDCRCGNPEGEEEEKAGRMGFLEFSNSRKSGMWKRKSEVTTIYNLASTPGQGWWVAGGEGIVEEGPTRSATAQGLSLGLGHWLAGGS